ncbi:MAG: hypothetical protein QM783_05165 [Phycisphaerales bacterium]
MSKYRPLVAASLSCLLAAAALADDITVTPGAGAIAAALAKAKSGDTVKIPAGEFTETVTVPPGVTLEGAGADKTTLTGVKFAAINAQAHARIIGFTIKAGSVTRGVNTSEPVRIERCRFIKVPEAVAMMGAPLSDVVACEFIDCPIGVRAIGKACPTVWGCLFRGGDMGVFAMDGSPYIRNNAFVGQKAGIRMLPPDMEPAIIRNNVFVNCSEAAVKVLDPKDGFGGPSIRNNVVQNCGAAVISPPSLTQNMGHTVFTVTKSPAFRDEKDAKTIEATSEGDAGAAVTDGGEITFKNAALLDGKGIRVASEVEGTKGTIGPEKEWMRVGVGATGTLPPQRFGGKDGRLIANAVAEEYQYLGVIRRPMGSQSMGVRNGVRCDTIKPGDGKEPTELSFDISRFFSESGLKP